MTPQSPKEALPGKFPPRGFHLEDLDGVMVVVWPSAGRRPASQVEIDLWLEIQEHESALAEAVRKEMELALAYGRLQALEQASISPCVLPSMLKAAEEEYRSALKAAKGAST